MTACTNKARGAVVAALAGVLALGAVPAVALATGSDVSLQFDTSTGAFEEAKVEEAHFDQGSALDIDTKTDGVYHVGYKKNTPVSLSWVKFSIYGEGTEDLLVIDPVKEPEKYEVSYYERNGEEMGEEVVDPTDAGDYYAVISAISGQYKGSQFAIPFAIDPIDISKLVKVDGELNSYYDAEAKDFYFYADNDGSNSYTNGDEKLYVGTDIKVTWYKVGDDLKDEYSVDSVVDAGKYRAYVEGQDNYTGSADLNAQIAEVKQLDLTAPEVFIPGIYCDNDNYGEPTDPQWILIDGQLFGSDSAIMGEIKAELNPTGSVDNTWYKPGLYKYDVTAQDANDPNFVSGTTRPVNAYKLSDKLSFTYKGETVQSGYDVFADGSEASFDDNLIVGKDSDGNEYKRANGKLNVMVFDSEGKKVYNTVAGSTSTAWWTQVGKDFTAIYWYENNDGTVGGQLVLPVHVYEEAVDADASAAVLYDVDGDKIKEVVSSIEATYSGDPLDIDVRVKEANGNVVTSGYTVSYYDAEGNQVREIVNAGTYTLKLTSDKYKLSGTTEMTITVKPLDLSAVNVGAIQTRVWDKVGNVTEYLRWNDDLAYNVARLDLSYGEKKVALPKDVRVTILDASGNQIDKIADEGVYTLRFEARNADAENNYVLPGDVTVTCIKDGWNKDRVSHLRFTDVEWSDYFANAVDLVAKRSLMTGYQGTNLFGADNTLNRGQMAIVLYNMAKFGPGIDESSLKYDETEGYKTGFDDVDGNMYYAKAIAWARQAGVVNGYDETHFGPEDNITREEFAAMIMNYEKKFGDYEQADASVLDDFSDAASITPWAKNAMSWAVANGVVNGTPEGTLIPTCDILRGDAACMVYNYVK